MTDETKNTVLTLLKADLGMMNISEPVLELLRSMTDAAVSFITGEGISLGNGAEDIILVEMCAAWLYRKRDSGEGMPRMLRWALNNRLMKEAGK